MNEAELRKVIGSLTQDDMEEIGIEDDLVARLGLDSLAGLRLLAAIEKRSGARFPDESLDELRTMKRILDEIAKRGTS